MKLQDNTLQELENLRLKALLNFRTFSYLNLEISFAESSDIATDQSFQSKYYFYDNLMYFL